MSTHVTGLRSWHSCALTGLVALGLSSRFAFADTATITVDASRPGPAINPRMYGIFLEEINHGVDGGLYGELIRNRAFEDARPPEGYAFRNGAWRDEHGFDSGFSRYGYTTNAVPFWSLIQEGAAQGSIHLETSGGISQQSAYCLRLDVTESTKGRIGVANTGFFGIGAREGARYNLSMFAKRSADFKGVLTARLESADGSACSETAKLNALGTNWQLFHASLTAKKTDPKARLILLADAKGSVWLDFVSLFPQATWKGRTNGLRPDIAQMIADLKPGFVRFPGGCVVEAGTVETAYNWKLTVGPLTEREERWGPWNYRRTQGMGLFEYLQFCEDLGAEPLYVGFAGQTCIFRQREHVPMDQMGWVRDNFLDVVEYANGSAESKWGRIRATSGHSAPFGLKYVEIGNENQGREFAERYQLIYDAMKARYPDLTYFADLSWTSRESMREQKFDVEDNHFYNSPRWFLSRFNEYDQRDRKLTPLYLGELAVTSREGGPLRGNLQAALAEGVFLMGCERNADAVRMVSYAPLLAHVEGRTELTGAPPPWHGMIYFDGTRAFGTVSYYLWKLFGQNRPSCSLQTEVSFPDAKPVTIAGQIGLGTWDATAEFKDVRVEREGTVLHQSQFDSGTNGWSAERGRWETAEGVYRQSRRGQGFSYVGDASWTDYTLSLKARKLSGGEGFLIVFGRKGADRYWWNLGGWGNSQHALEFNQSPVGRPVRGHIETDRWYDIKIALNGNRVRCYLDGELIHDATVSAPQTFFALAGRDNDTGAVVLKAINTSEQEVSAKLKLQGAAETAGDAEVTVIESGGLSDNNSLEEPTRVIPKQSRVSNIGAEFSHQFPPRSFSILRLKAR